MKDVPSILIALAAAVAVATTAAAADMFPLVAVVQAMSPTLAIRQLRPQPTLELRMAKF